jgi:DNA integrity scanning protein DisA with diadenylate cyclase activity
MSMNPQDAYNTLVRDVYMPVFLTKLASDFGIHPETEEEAVAYVQMAGKLQNACELEAVKTAGQRTELVSDVNDKLDNLLQEYGYGVRETSNQVKEAAEGAFQNDKIQEAAKVFNEYLAHQLQTTSN